jgi:hypothetical protein
VHHDRTAAPPVVPADFWTHPPLAEALALQHMGLVVRAYRCHPWHGRTPLPQPVIGDWLSLTQVQVSRLENGPARKHLDWLRFAARTLRIPADLLWFRPADGPGGWITPAARSPTPKPAARWSPARSGKAPTANAARPVP